MMLIGHRGDPEYHHQNTIAGFMSAEAAGAGMIELDLRITADGIVIALHDGDVLVSGVPTPVASLTHRRLRAALHEDAVAPAFEDILAATSGPLMVDIKDAAAAGAAASMTEGHRDRLLLAGAYDDLVIARAALAGSDVALTWESRTYPRAHLDRLRAGWYNPTWRVLDRDLVEQAHADGRRVSTWTVDDHEVAASVVAAGVDAVITNRLRAMRSVVLG